MLKGKKLYYVLGLGAVAYYFYWMNKKNKAAKVIAAPAATNFTGDLDVTEYQNAYGVSRAPYASQRFDFSAGNQITNPYKNTYRGR